MMRLMTDERAWFASYPSDVPRSLAPYPKESLFALLRSAVAGFPDRPALAFFGAHMTYAELMSEVERFSAVLAGLGVRQGDRVGMILPNCPEYVIAFFACQRIGAVAVGNNPLYTERELEHQIKDSGATIMIVLDQIYHRFGRVSDAHGRPRGHRGQAQPLHAGAHQVAGAAEVQVRREEAGHAAAVRPRRPRACGGGPT